MAGFEPTTYSVCQQILVNKMTPYTTQPQALSYNCRSKILQRLEPATFTFAICFVNHSATENWYKQVIGAITLKTTVEVQ